jgi:hypothetical protein
MLQGDCLWYERGGDGRGKKKQKKKEHLHMEMMKSTSLEARP